MIAGMVAEKGVADAKNRTAINPVVLATSKTKIETGRQGTGVEVEVEIGVGMIEIRGGV